MTVSPDVRHARHAALLFLGALFLAGPTYARDAAPSPASPDPAAVIGAIDSASLDADGARPVSRLRLDAGMGTVFLDNGLVVPAKPVGGVVREAVFLGTGRFVFKAPDAVERRQLELFTGGQRLDERFASAVLVLGNPELATLLFSRPAVSAPAPERLAEARTLFERWTKATERKRLHLHRALLSAGIDHGDRESFFAAFVQGETLRDFVFAVDPAEEEQVSVQQFVRLVLEGLDKDALEQTVRKEKKKGRYSDFDATDVGDWDIWASASQRDDGGRPVAGAAGFSARHYAMDVTLAGHDLGLSAKTTVRLVAESGGYRVVPLSINGALKVEHVRLGGSDVFFDQKGQYVTVVLPEAPAAGSEFELSLEYRGDVIENVRASYVLVDTTRWYPWCGERSKSTFDVTYHYPRGLEVISGGKKVESGTAPDGTAWQRRKMDFPVAFLSFEIGDYKVLSAKAGHVDVTLALDPMAEVRSQIGGAEILKTITSAMEYYEATFGPYPLDYLSVVTSPRGFSQGSLSMLSLSTYMLATDERVAKVFALTEPRAVVAHELAHQWWGNLVGWPSYRDQWISEATANYAATLYTRDRLQNEIPNQRLVGMLAKWRSELGGRTSNGRDLDEMGPVTIGYRLMNSIDRSHDSYQAIIYKKGAVVLDSIAQLFRNEADFTASLRKIVELSANRTIDTAQFLEMCARLGGMDLDPLARRLVYGTGIPEYIYNYEIRPQGGRWILSGTVERHVQAPLRFGLRRTAKGGLDITRTAVVPPPEDGFALAVPIEIAVVKPGGGKGILDAKLVVKGERSTFELPLDVKPESMRIDPKGQVYAMFYSEQATPKRVLFYRGRALAGMGEFDSAIDMLGRSLTAKVRTNGDLGPNDNSKAQAFEADLVEKLVHQELAAVYADKDQQAKAEEEAGQADTTRAEMARHLRATQEKIDARLAIRRGDYREAYGLLKNRLDDTTRAHYMYLNSPLRTRDPLRDTESWLLLALAARGSDHPEDFEKARRRAQRGGADVSLLSEGQ